MAYRTFVLLLCPQPETYGLLVPKKSPSWFSFEHAILLPLPPLMQFWRYLLLRHLLNGTFKTGGNQAAEEDYILSIILIANGRGHEVLVYYWWLIDKVL